MVMSPPGQKLIKYRCYKPFKGGMCGRLLMMRLEPVTSFTQVHCSKCGELVEYPQPEKDSLVEFP